MKYNMSPYPIGNIIENLKTKKLLINKEYQRNSGLWPISAQSYFVDTLLEGFPCPPIFLYQNFDKERKTSYSEVIDGQQRLTTIMDFCSDKFKLGRESKNFGGLLFSQLDGQKQEDFFTTNLDAVTILNGSRAEILEMFRRMNAYTLPLVNPEKRNAKYQGEFKWFTNDLGEVIAPYLAEFGILPAKKIVRLFDLELITELCVALDTGVVTRSGPLLDKMFEKNDFEFEHRALYYSRITEFFAFIGENFSELKKSKIFTSNNFHDLFVAATHLKYGIPNLENESDVKPIGAYFSNVYDASRSLENLNAAVENEVDRGIFKDFVRATKRSTTKKPERLIKIKTFAEALQGKYL